MLSEKSTNSDVANDDKKISFLNNDEKLECNNDNANDKSPSSNKLSTTKPSSENSLASLNDEFNNNGYLCIPKYRHGTEIPYANGGPRNVPSTCAICLSDYKEGDTIIWSDNAECCHAFHEDCILTWLLSNNDNGDYMCPCCRQTFLHKKDSFSNNSRRSDARHRSSLTASFGPFASLQGNTRPLLTVEQFVQSTPSRDDDEEEEENQLPSIFDIPDSVNISNEESINTDDNDNPNDSSSSDE